MNELNYAASYQKFLKTLFHQGDFSKRHIRKMAIVGLVPSLTKNANWKRNC